MSMQSPNELITHYVIMYWAPIGHLGTRTFRLMVWDAKASDQCLWYSVFLGKEEREVRATGGLFDLLIEWMRIEKQKKKTFNKSLYWAYRHDWSCFDWQTCSVFIALDIRLCIHTNRMWGNSCALRMSFVHHVLIYNIHNRGSFRSQSLSHLSHFLLVASVLFHFSFLSFRSSLHASHCWTFLFSNVIITWHIQFIGNQIFLLFIR